MNIIYLDCFSGISGDMFLAALIDLGFPVEELERVIAQLNIPVEVEKRGVTKGGIRATQVVFHIPHPHPCCRTFNELQNVLSCSSLPAWLRTQAEKALFRLAQAEAVIHGQEPGQVHFHELGGFDTLVDLVGTMAGIATLGVKKIYSSPLPLARGIVQTTHGPLPLPAPATLHLLQGVPTYGVSLNAELVTPTGALLVTALANAFGPPPPAIWEKIGHGAGIQELFQPNVLRVWLGKSFTPAPEEKFETFPYDGDVVLVLETQVDDVNSEFLPYLRSQLEREGALDVAFLPAIMKKGRPGTIITVICPQDRLLSLAQVIFQESTALGLRWHPVYRLKLFRSSLEVATPYGTVPVKLGFAQQADGSRECINMAPEYEVCARYAQEAGASIKEVYQAALSAARTIVQKLK